MIKLLCQCGEIYYSDRKHIGKNIQCKKCLSIITIQESVTPLSDNSTRQAATPISPKKHTVLPRNFSIMFRKYFKVGIFVAISLVAVFYFVAMYTSSQNATQPTSPAKQNVVPSNICLNEKQHDNTVEPTVPRRVPLGSSPFGTGIRSGKSSLSVDNGTENDALVKVIHTGPTKQLIRNFFIANGQQFTAEQLPPGNYILRVALGRDWDSERRRFNFRRSFGETESFDITESKWNEPTDDGYIEHIQASKMSITLHKVLHGNFKQHEISEEDF